MPLLDHAGNAPTTTLATDITNVALTFDLSASTGFPAGGANGKFWVTFDRGGLNEERILVASRTGVTCTISSLGDRGRDGTAAAGHTAGESIEHTFAGEEAHEYNQHLFDVTQDEHTQYMKTDGTRHDLAARHTFAALGWTPGTPTGVVANQAASQGAGTHPARDTHTHAGPVSGTPVAVGTVLSAGSGTAIALANHVHELGAGSIDLPSFFAAGVVDSAAHGAASVIAGKIAAGGVSATNQVTDGIITLLKFASEASSTYVPASFSDGTFDLGTGGTKYGNFFKLGRIVVGWAGFAMAADGNLTGTVIIPLPVAMKAGGATNQRGFAAARAQGGGANVFSGTGVILGSGSQVNNIFTAGAGVAWDSTTPFNWGTSGVGACNLDTLFAYEAAA
jgi:hypothetical protein